MKKLTTLLLALAATLVLTACGGGGGSDSSDSRDTTTTTGNLKLSWVAPSARADSSYLPITDLEGFRIYYGTSASDLDMLVDLNDNSITEYTLDTLPSGNYYFTVTAYDSEGNESGYSQVINTDV